MKAHGAVETFHKVAGGGEDADSQAEGIQVRDPIAVRAAVVVAVLAAFLAIATFLSNEAVKEVITGETKAADTSAQLEANDVKTIIANADALLLRVVGTGNPKEAAAATKAEELEKKVQSELKPTDRRLAAEIAA